MPQTKADRQESAQKAAATRKRNKVRAESSTRGTKAASSRQRNRAGDNLGDARKHASTGASNLANAGKSLADAAVEAASPS